MNQTTLKNLSRLAIFTTCSFLSVSSVQASDLYGDNLGVTGFATIGGGPTTNAKLFVYAGLGDLQSDFYGYQSALNYSPTQNDATHCMIGAYGTVCMWGTANNTASYGLRSLEGFALHNGSGTVGGAVGVFGLVQNLASGTIQSANGALLQVGNSGTGTIQTGCAACISSPFANGPINTAYGVFVYDQKVPGVTTAYSFYASGASDLNSMPFRNSGRKHLGTGRFC